MKRLTALGVAVLMFATAGCASSGGPSSSGGDQHREITVFAASSLTATFTQIGKDFEAANPGVTVTFNFGPSDGLAGQIESEGVGDQATVAMPTERRLSIIFLIGSPSQDTEDSPPPLRFRLAAAKRWVSRRA